MRYLGRITLFFSSFLLLSPTFAFTQKSGTDDPVSFYSCFYLGNIVDDAQNDDTPTLDENMISFHDGRAIQLYAMGKLTDGHSKEYIEEYTGKISDFARAIPEISEANSTPDWYDGRVASLAGILFCAEDDENNDGLSDTFPRETRPEGFSSLFPTGGVLNRLEKYMQPCCTLSGSTPEETVDFFPCALQ